jgi:hypothetical protein
MVWLPTSRRSLFGEQVGSLRQPQRLQRREGASTALLRIIRRHGGHERYNECCTPQLEAIAESVQRPTMKSLSPPKRPSCKDCAQETTKIENKVA